MAKSYIPILLIVLLSCCPFLPTKEKSSATVPANVGSNAPQQVKKGITLKEAWELAKPEAQAWAATLRRAKNGYAMELKHPDVATGGAVG